MRGKFAKDTFFTLASRTFQLLLTLGVSVIIARTLGPEGKGIYSLCVLFGSLLITFSNFGLGSAFVYYLGRKKYSPKEVFGLSILLSFLLGGVFSFLGLFFILFFSEKFFPGIDKKYLFFILLSFPIHLFIVTGIYILLGLKKIKKYNLVSVFQALSLFFFIFIFLYLAKEKVEFAIFSYVLSLALGAFILFIFLKKEAKKAEFKIKKEIFKDFFSYGIKIYIGNILAFLQYRLNMFFVNYFTGTGGAGIFSVALSLAEKIWLISQSGATVLFPKIASEKDKKLIKRFTPLVCRNIFFITFIFALFIFIFAKPLILFLFSEKFIKAIFPLQILLLGAICLSGSRILSNDIAARGKPEINCFIGGGGLILNIILNLIFIPKIGISGAAFATTISYIFNLLVRSFVYSKISQNRFSDLFFPKKSDFRYLKILAKDILKNFFL